MQSFHRRPTNPSTLKPTILEGHPNCDASTYSPANRSHATREQNPNQDKARFLRRETVQSPKRFSVKSGVTWIVHVWKPTTLPKSETLKAHQHWLQQFVQCRTGEARTDSVWTRQKKLIQYEPGKKNTDSLFFRNEKNWISIFWKCLNFNDF